ncbi:MAG: hypothetical protein JXO22_05895 [Phycisphaerae bacterium]|nr:hypothetical protein [Phycisphaerae bacterium]
MLLNWLWSVGTLVGGLLRPRVREVDIRRQDYRGQTRGMGLRMTEPLRDRLRRRWLRVRRDSE